MNVILYTFKINCKKIIIILFLYLFTIIIYDYKFKKIIYVQETIVAKINFQENYKDISLPAIFKNGDLSNLLTLNEFRSLLVTKLNAKCNTNIAGVQANEILSNHVNISRESSDYYKIYSYSNLQKQTECINDITLIVMNEFIKLIVSKYKQKSNSIGFRIEKYLDKNLYNSSKNDNVNIGYSKIINNIINNSFYYETYKIETELNLKNLSLSMNSASPEIKFYMSLQSALKERKNLDADISEKSTLDLSYIHKEYVQDLDLINNWSLIQNKRNIPQDYLHKFLIFDSYIINKMNSTRIFFYILSSLFLALISILIYRIIIINIIINKTRSIK